MDYPGTFSPDGRSLAFVSARGTANPSLPNTIPELWLSRTDGTGLRQLAMGPHLTVGTWSPDGSRIVYDAVADGNSELFVVDAAGGQPKRLTHDSAIDGSASFSRDGRSIYFTSNRGGSRTVPDIWQIPAEGGSAVRVTYHGGLRPLPSPDGKYLYYADRPTPGDGATGNARLMQVPADGGEETPLFSGVTPLWWAVTHTGILFVTREAEHDALDRFDFRDRKITRAGILPFRAAPMGTQMSASSDGRWATISQQRVEQDLMLLDNFR